jgi:hypothetical protein
MEIEYGVEVITVYALLELMILMVLVLDVTSMLISSITAIMVDVTALQTIIVEIMDYVKHVLMVINGTVLLSNVFLFQ